MRFFNGISVQPLIVSHARTGSAALAVVGAMVLSGCATHNFGEVAPPPPPPSSGTVLADWRGLISSDDRGRYQRRDQAWKLALEQSRRQTGSGDLSALGDLLKPDAALNNASIAAGDYRCRTIKLGSQGGQGGLGYVVYGWFACRVEQTSQGLKFSKVTGSQRPEGLLYPEDNKHMIFLGAMALAGEPSAPRYRAVPERDIVSVLERIGPARWRLVTPWPARESNLDIIELVPA